MQHPPHTRTTRDGLRSALGAGLMLVSLLAAGAARADADAMRWSDLSPAQQEVLANSRGAWDDLPADTRRTLADQAARWAGMDEQQRAEARARMAEQGEPGLEPDRIPSSRIAKPEPGGAAAPDAQAAEPPASYEQQQRTRTREREATENRGGQPRSMRRTDTMRQQRTRGMREPAGSGPGGPMR